MSGVSMVPGPSLHGGAHQGLLKKTRTGNLFTIFGQPDVDIRRVGEGQLQVEIRGLDTYNPTNGEVVPQSTADIACWFKDIESPNQRMGTDGRTMAPPPLEWRL